MTEVRFIAFDFDHECQPPAYAGIVVSTSSKGEIARFKSSNPVKDWGDMTEWFGQHPGPAMTTSSFDEFGWYVPGFRFVLDPDGHETLVDDPRDFLHGKVPEDGDHAVSRTARFVVVLTDPADEETYLGIAIRTRDGELARFDSGNPKDDWARTLARATADDAIHLVTRDLLRLEVDGQELLHSLPVPAAA